MKRKVLFLDIDGVLNTFNPDSCGIDEKLLANLATIIGKTGCSIVLSSTWKYSKNKFDRFTRDILSKLPQGCFVGCTPTILPQVKRENEIKLWLKNNPNVDTWIVLDDYDFELTSIKDHCVITNELHGLTVEKMNECIEKLKGLENVEIQK